MNNFKKIEPNYFKKSNLIWIIFVLKNIYGHILYFSQNINFQFW